MFRANNEPAKNGLKKGGKKQKNLAVEKWRMRSKRNKKQKKKDECY